MNAALVCRPLTAKKRANLHARIVRLRDDGVALTAIHDGIPGATWREINDALTDIWWRRTFFLMAVQARRGQTR